MSDPVDFPKPVLILIALIQGVLLLFLHLAIEQKHWPYNEPQWLFAFFTASVAGPSLLLLSLQRSHWPKIAACTLSFTLLIAVLGYYVGSQISVDQHVGAWSVGYAYAITIGIACFKALMYVQQRSSGEPLTYSLLFRFSWRNFLITNLALTFMSLFWAILMLWAALFKTIKIDFFYDLFTDKYFLYPILSMANGFGVLIFGGQLKVIDTITRIQQLSMKFLLIILVLIAIIFLAALPFTGLEPLWQTRRGSLLILWLQALVLFFLNAVYQEDARARPYSLFLHRFIYVGVALLPIYSAISFYGLQLRIVEYGWTLERCWGVSIWVVLALFSVGYLWGIIKRNDLWVENLSRVNVRMGLFVLGLMLLVNSPLLDFRKISVASQLARLHSGKLTLDNFDYDYFYRWLARPGQDALESIKRDVAKSRPEIAEKIESLLAGSLSYSKKLTAGELENILQVIPDGTSIPADLSAAILKWQQRNVWMVSRPDSRQIIFAVDMDGDRFDEYVIVGGWDSLTSATLFYRSGIEWKNIEVQGDEDWDISKIEADVRAGDLHAVRPQWSNLRIGDMILYPQATR